MVYTYNRVVSKHSVQVAWYLSPFSQSKFDNDSLPLSPISELVSPADIDVDAWDRDSRFIAFSLLSIFESRIFEVLFLRFGACFPADQVSMEEF